MRKTAVFLGAVVWMSVYAGLTARYGAVWENEVTLGLYASERAPLKPRPHLNLAVALMERQRFVEAEQVLDYTGVMLKDANHLTPLDASEATRALMTNRLALSRLTDRGFHR